MPVILFTANPLNRFLIGSMYFCGDGALGCGSKQSRLMEFPIKFKLIFKTNFGQEDTKDITEIVFTNTNFYTE